MPRLQRRPDLQLGLGWHQIPARHSLAPRKLDEWNPWDNWEGNSCNQPERSLKVTLQQERNEEQWWTRLLGFIQTHPSAAFTTLKPQECFSVSVKVDSGDRFLLRTGLDWAPLAQLAMLHLTMSHTDTRKLTWTAWGHMSCSERWRASERTVRSWQCTYIFPFSSPDMFHTDKLPRAVVEFIFPWKATFVGTSVTTVDGWGRWTDAALVLNNEKNDTLLNSLMRQTHHYT